MNDRLLKLKSQALFRGVGPWAAASTLAGIAFVYFLKGHVPNKEIFIWFAAFFCANLFRFFLYLKYTKENYQDLNSLQKSYLATMVGTGVIWGSMSLITIHQLPITLEAIYVGFILGVTANGAISVVPDKRASWLFAAAMVIPYMIKTYVEADPFYIPYILVQGIFLVFIFSLCSRFNRELTSNNELVIQKEDLVDQLTEKFDLERQLKEEKLKSLQASKYAAIGEMAAGVGHEINNPLTIVLGYLWKMDRLISKKEGMDEIRDLVKKTTEASKRIAEIVKTMRDFSTMRGKDTLEAFYLSAVIKMVQPLVVKTTAYQGVDFSFDLTDVKVQGNQSEFAQALYNLISNAAQAVEAEENVENRVEIKSDYDDNYAYLRVINEGPIIPQEVVDKMFQPFYTTKEIGKGTGLGLSLAKTIMENNRGELIYDRIDQKTVFTMKVLKA